MNCFKLNCDASIIQASKKATVGGVLRNHNGAAIFALLLILEGVMCWRLSLMQSSLGRDQSLEP